MFMARTYDAPVIRWCNSRRLDIPAQHVVDEARLAGAVVAEDEHKRHFRRLVASGVQLLKWSVHVVVEGLDETGMQLITTVHDVGLHLAIYGR